MECIYERRGQAGGLGGGPGTCSHGLRGTQAEILWVFQTLCLRVQWPLKTVYNPYTQGHESACEVLGGACLCGTGVLLRE